MSGIRINGRPVSEFSPAVQAEAEKLIRELTGGAGVAGEAPQGVATAGAATDEADLGYKDFDWNVDLEDVVVPAQLSIAVYANPQDQVVIRSSPLPGSDQDEVVIISPDYAVDVAEKILEVARQSIEGRGGG